MKHRPWEIIIPQLTSAFSQVGKEWFDQCCQNIPSEYVQTTRPWIFAGEVVESITVMQIMTLSTVLNKPRVLTKAEERIILPILFRQAFIDPELAAERMCDYYQRDADSRAFTFGATVAKYITGDEYPLEAAVFCSCLSESLIGMTGVEILSIFMEHNIRPLPWWKRPFV